MAAAFQSNAFQNNAFEVGGALPPITGTLAATETGSDTFAGAGDVIVKGTLAATETGKDTFAGSGDIIVKGTLAATESGKDTFVAVGDVIVRGSMAATETGADTFFATGGTVTLGTMAATETGADTFSASGKVIVRGSMAATESGSDTLVASGTVLVRGTMAVTESGQDVMVAAGVVFNPVVTPIVGTMSATESGADFTDGYTYPEYVEPPGYYDGWTGFVTDASPTGGGGPGNAVSIQPRKPKGWANERAQFEQSQVDIERIAQTLTESEQPKVQRIARKLVDYTGELAQIESLQRELLKLESAKHSQILEAEKNQEIKAALAELNEILQDDEDAAEALLMLHEVETRQLLGILQMY